MKAEAERLALLQEQERKRAGSTNTGGLRSGHVFRDCPECPELVVVPAGEFTMGSSASEEGHAIGEAPQRQL